MKKFKVGDRVSVRGQNDITVGKVEGDYLISGAGDRVKANVAKLATGGDELRLIVQNVNTTRDGFNDNYTTEQLIQIYRMQLASEWNFYPDQWTPRQVREALAGKPPQWDAEEKPMYGSAK